MSKTKVLLIQEVITNYRDPIYRIIAEKYDFTVAYTDKTEIEKSTYKIVKFPSYKLWKIIIHKRVDSFLRQFDVVILLPHLKFVWLNHILFTKHPYKLITWSIGVHVSYNRVYDLTKSPSLQDRIYELLQDQADACIFYTKEPIDYWKKYKVIDTNKYFIAHNTVEVVDIEDPISFYDKKDSFLFIGTLYKQKGIGELIEAYANARDKNDKLPMLNIIGKGPEKDLIIAMVQEYHLEDKVKLLGPIYDEMLLAEYFKKAFFCISPKQAGLSVLKSLGYGVPFVTRSNAITGGERNNIINGVNGFFYNSEAELSSILSETVCKKEKIKEMSVAAYNYYKENATPQKMAQGVIDAIDFSLGK